MPAAGRRKRLLIADMDSTIIGVECIDELADFAGLKPEVAAITEAAMRGELDFEAALIARVALLRGLPEAVLERCYAERVRLNPGARTLVRTMAALGADDGAGLGRLQLLLRAGGRRRRVSPGTRRTGCWSRTGVLTGEVGAADPRARGQARGARGAARRRPAIGPEAVLAVGDGANDLDMVRAAGLGVAYHAKPALAAVADARLEHSDLTALLALQGIPEAEWRD